MEDGSITESITSDLRMRAVSRLAEHAGPNAAPPDPFIGLRALYDMASTPETAGHALAMLHELQVHQIEINLQDEELRLSRAELEATLLRQEQVFDHLPVACLVIDADSVVSAANLASARLLGQGRDALLGRRLDGLLAPEGAVRLRALLARLGGSLAIESATLALVPAAGNGTQLELRASRDPDGTHFLLALSAG